MLFPNSAQAQDQASPEPRGTVDPKLSKPATQFNQQHQQGLKRNPEGVTVTLRMRDGKRQWMQGEPIKVELTFSSNRGHAYGVNTASHDRSGRLGIDVFHLDPREGTVDPLCDYFYGQLSGFMGGLFSDHPLDEAPFVFTYELNEWLRFERPGHYRLYVMSGRVTLPHEQTRSRPSSLPVTSNIIEFEVLPTERGLGA